MGLRSINPKVIYLLVLEFMHQQDVVAQKVI